MQKQLVLKSFSNKEALKMGLKVVDLAQQKGLIIGVEISRLNQTIFLFIDDGLPADKHNWIRRKANVVEEHTNESGIFFASHKTIRCEAVNAA
ncbi:MAG: heme-binding protein [Pseudomonadales bacterium]|nr:heme-binding protein [Pseudomonadales bacterium]